MAFIFIGLTFPITPNELSVKKLNPDILLQICIQYLKR